MKMQPSKSPAETEFVPQFARYPCCWIP